jgi:small subunit ribosomal protein S2
MATKYKVPSIEDLLSSGAHFGHAVHKWHPKAEEYIFTARKGIHLIDLEKTHSQLVKAAELAYQTALKGEKIVFVGTKKQAKDVIVQQAQKAGVLYVNERWLGGTITNFDIIRKNIDKLIDLIKKREQNAFSHYTKKEKLMIDREIAKLERVVGGLKEMNVVPSLMLVIDAKREHTAIREALQKNIPVIGIVDTNTDPNLVSLPIPANDDAIRSIAIIVKTIAGAIEAGYNDFAESMTSAPSK